MAANNNFVLSLCSGEDTEGDRTAFVQLMECVSSQMAVGDGSGCVGLQ